MDKDNVYAVWEGNVLAGIGLKDVGHRGEPIDKDLLNANSLADLGFLIEGLASLAHQITNAVAIIDANKINHTVLTGKPPGF